MSGGRILNGLRGRMSNPRSRSRAGWRLGLLLATAFVGVPDALGCRYNVRDLGFIDVQSEGYVLHWLVPENADQETMAKWRAGIQPVLSGSNIGWDAVPVDEVASHENSAHLNPAIDLPLPTGVLVSPDGFATNLFQDLPRSPGVDVAVERIRGWVSSPTREAIASAGSRAFGVVLLIEGTDGEANKRAVTVIEEAFAEIAEGMANLPKEIVEPPALVRLPSSEVERERVLFWSMGLEPKAVEAPRAAIFYGRARWIGPLIEMQHLSVYNLTQLFWVIGADCECGMDLGWTRGTVLPLRWTEDLHATASESLGFDPDSPMVRAEALRILNRYSRVAEFAAADVQRGANPRQETQVEEETGATSSSPTVSGTNQATVAQPDARSREEDAKQGYRTSPSRVLLVMAVIGMIVILGTLLVLLTAMHRWRESARGDDR